MRFIICTLHEILASSKQEDKMSGTRIMDVKGEKFIPTGQ
jgi:hypothetical protein